MKLLGNIMIFLSAIALLLVINILILMKAEGFKIGKFRATDKFN